MFKAYNLHSSAKKLSSFLLGIGATCLTAMPGQAAEELFFIYSPVNFSVEVSSLELFAKEGKINKNLEFYLQFATPEQKAAFRETLTKKIDLPPVVVSRFFNTAIGEDILTRLGKGITIQGGSNGKYALRAALVEAAFDPQGFTLINVLKKLPTNMEFQGALLLGFAEESKKFILATETLVKELRQLTAQEAASDRPVDYAQLTDMRQAGPHKVTKEVWNLTDTSRNRSFYVDVYLPQSVDGKMPVVVFSHGLASRPEDYGQGLERLASYGFLVVAPQHPGSDIIWAKEVLEGYHRDSFDLNDFINRPKDISFVIDELERRNATQFQNRLDLQNVGMGGHSFGGYTTLAIAGAEIDFDYLKKECEQFYGGINVSLLLECRALDLPRQTYNFRDNRVKAVFAANPVNRAIFGPKGLSKITIPIMFGSGSYDPAAPPVLEQTASFIWLGSPQKYWAMVEGQAHVNFSELDAGLSQSIKTVTQLTLPSQDLITNYTAAIEIPFFEIYINQNEKFRPYLQSAYAEYLSQGEQFKLDFISQDSVPKLIEAIEKFKQKNP